MCFFMSAQNCSHPKGVFCALSLIRKSTQTAMFISPDDTYAEYECYSSSNLTFARLPYAPSIFVALRSCPPTASTRSLLRPSCVSHIYGGNLRLGYVLYVRVTEIIVWGVSCAPQTRIFGKSDTLSPEMPYPVCPKRRLSSFTLPKRAPNVNLRHPLF